MNFYRRKIVTIVKKLITFVFSFIKVFMNVSLAACRFAFLCVFISLLFMQCSHAEENGVEIIDGGDSESLKALYPSTDDATTDALERMRETRLSYEKTCVKLIDEKMLSIVFMSTEATSDKALALSDSVSELIDEKFVGSGLEVVDSYPPRVQVQPARMAVRGRAGYSVLVSRAWSVKDNPKRLESLRKEFDKDYTVHITDLARCPDGNKIHSE